MRRALIAASLTGGLALTGVVGFQFTQSSAQTGNGAAPVAKAAEPQLPIAHVVLFSSGVGYFQREGEVQGNTRVDLSFPVQDINDLLKSMVLSDLGGGRISAVSYDSQAPIDKTLRSFAVNLTNNPTFGQILNQARGEKVETVLQQTNNTQPATMTGVIMGVERKKEAVGKEAVESEFLNLWCAEGMRSVRMSDVQRVRFLNPTMDSEVKKALEVLALSHDTQKKAVSVSFNGEGKRAVKVGYVVENPIWKTSYRLVLDKDNKAFLQGWAVVENTQDDDWNNVRMSLISGRPISFQMDLYQPLYVSRPVVEPELFASLRPPTYNGNLKNDGIGNDPDKPTNYNLNRIEDGSVPGAIAPPPGVAGGFSGGMPGDGNGKRKLPTIDPSKGVTSSAVATELGDYFQYLIEHPVNLPRQKSAMLPIVNQEVSGTKVSIYNEGTHAKFPLLGLKFKNTTKLHLMQGPITVFDNSSYAGDARILDLQPKEERLISYAIDLGVEVEPVANETKNRIIKVKIDKGVIEATHKVRESKTYNVKNRTENDRVLLIEHPYRPEFKLMKPEKAEERARDVYRFEVAVASGKTASREIVEEQEQLNQVSLSNTDDNTIRVFLSEAVTSDKVKAALREAIALRTKWAATQQDIQHKERRLNDIRQDQVRLRANLKEVPPTSEAYKRYVKKFDDQETEIEQLQDTIKKLQENEYAQRKGYETYLSNLTIE
ncbi:MAG: DUF4139 domain-containing protein [Gemmataceae bacterium]|nr:DUF4139 domain-containing protein [Gemmataceae bacterium]